VNDILTEVLNELMHEFLELKVVSE